MSMPSFNNSLAASAASGFQPQNATGIGQDRIVRKETSLGAVREIEPPEGHIGLQFAPWKEVPTDDVVWDYLTVQTSGLAPARAEDAESELAQKDSVGAGQGRASVIDWAIKDHYDASDVNRAREFERIQAAMRGAGGALPLTVSSATEGWAERIANDRLRRRRKLDNRLEWLILTALATGQIAYDDGKIKFLVDYGRPANQRAGNAANDLAAAGITDGVWDISGFDFDPLRTINELNEWHNDLRGVRFDRVVGSRKAFNAFVNSDKFAQRAGLGSAWTGDGTQTAPDPLYLIDGWGPEAARALVQRVTGVTFIEADHVYRTRNIGSKVVNATRFWPQNRLLFLPSAADMAEIATTELGFAKTLTSPHPEGNWQPGFYEWERSTVDPWGQDMGNGCKMFPVFPHMEYTYAVDVVLPS